jgi:hypothetical protein
LKAGVFLFYGCVGIRYFYPLNQEYADCISDAICVNNYAAKEPKKGFERKKRRWEDDLAIGQGA